MRLIRQKTKDQKELSKAQAELLDAQTMAATLFEQNQQLSASLLDTQELLANIIENGGKA